MIKKSVCGLFFVFLFLFVSTPAHALFNYLGLGEDHHDEIFLEVGEINVIKVDSPHRVSVRNPRIISVTEVKENEVIIAAEQQGETALTIWERDKERIFYVTVSPIDPSRLKQKLEAVIHKNLEIPNVYFRENELDGKVMIMGTVTRSEKERIEKVLSSFYDDRGESQVFDNLLVVGEEKRMVMIEITILELSKTFADTLGFDWPGRFEITAPASGPGSLGDVFRITDWTRGQLNWEIMLSSAEGRGRILARPRLLCLSGEEASFLVGGEIPVVTATVSPEGALVAEDIEYKEYGIDLNIRPTVTDDQQIRLDLKTEVKELSSEGQYLRADQTAITAFTTRQVSSTLRLNPGQGVVMSGLIEEKVTRDDLRKVPGLERIPILGALFRSKDYLEDETELVISLIPRIIDSGASKGREVLTQEPKKDLDLNNYISRVQKNIYGALKYHDMGRGPGWQGNTRVRLHLNHNGDLLEAKIVRSSGYTSFDREIIRLMKSLFYPSFPPSIDLQDLWIEVPVVYTRE